MSFKPVKNAYSASRKISFGLGNKNDTKGKNPTPFGKPVSLKRR